MKWVISVNNMVYPPITPSRQKGNKKHDKVHKDYKYKRYKRRFTKPATTSIIPDLLILIKITSWVQSIYERLHFLRCALKKRFGCLGNLSFE